MCFFVFLSYLRVFVWSIRSVVRSFVRWFVHLFVGTFIRWRSYHICIGVQIQYTYVYFFYSKIKRARVRCTFRWSMCQSVFPCSNACVTSVLLSFKCCLHGLDSYLIWTILCVPKYSKNKRIPFRIIEEVMRDSNSFTFCRRYSSYRKASIKVITNRINVRSYFRRKKERLFVRTIFANNTNIDRMSLPGLNFLQTLDWLISTKL